MKLRTGRPLSEMVDALERQTLLLQEFCQRAFAEGDLTYLAEIANKLRLLAVRSKNNEPLLLRVMEEHNLDLKIPVGPGPIESAPRISIEQFLAQPAGAVRIPFPDGEFVSYTNGQLIRAWAEQLGGAHEDWRMEDAFRTLLALPAFVGSRAARPAGVAAVSGVPITLSHTENGVKLRPVIGAVIYVRVSAKEQTENLSLPTQLRACEEYCRREGS